MAEGVKNFPKGRIADDLAITSDLVFSRAGLFNADWTPLNISKAVFTLSRFRIDGKDYRSQIRSSGILPLFNASVVQDLVVDGQEMFKNIKSSVGRVSDTEIVSVSWSVTRPLSVLKSLLTQFLFGFIKGQVSVKISALGFNKTFKGRARIPVNNVEWRF